MKILLVLTVILAPAELLLVTEGPAAVKTTSDGDGQKDEDALTLPAGKCADIVRDSGHPEDEACTEHCKALRKELVEGRCVEGTCQCKLDISDIIQSIAVQKKAKRKGFQGRPGVKCRRLIRFGGQGGAENHRGCGVHCRLLSPENKDGRCVEGICHCSKEVIEKKPTKIQKDDDEDEEEEDEEGEEKSGCWSKEGCSNGCRCIDGECRCDTLSQTKIPDTLLLPTTTVETPSNTHILAELPEREIKKCEHRRKSANEEICRAYCKSFSRDHTQGRCVNGVCQCGYAVFELENEEKDTGVVKMKEKKVRRSRGRS